MYVCMYVYREMLMSALRVLVKNSVKENFDITFMENEKAVKTLVFFFFFFSHKKFL